MTDLQFEQNLAQYVEFIKQEYRDWSDQTSIVRQQMIKEFEDSHRLDRGSKFIKVVFGGSVHSFIVVKSDAKFKTGDVLKAASWAAPAKNFARGSIMDGSYTKRVTWTGAN